jgi:hypothetical protein
MQTTTQLLPAGRVYVSGVHAETAVAQTLQAVRRVFALELHGPLELAGNTGNNTQRGSRWTVAAGLAKLEGEAPATPAGAIVTLSRCLSQLERISRSQLLILNPLNPNVAELNSRAVSQKANSTPRAKHAGMLLDDL